MRRAGLTNHRIETATAGNAGRRRLSDWPTSPLVLVVSGPSSHKAWTSRPRVGGRAQTLTHGTYPSVPLQLARERARAVARAIAAGITDRVALRAIARGIDPNQATAHPVDTIEKTAAEFIARHLRGRRRSPRYIRNVEGRFRNHILSVIGSRDLRSVSRREIAELLDAVHDNVGPIAANQVLVALHGLFRWARQRDLVETIPTEGIVKPGVDHKRERVLDDRELALVMRAARRLGYPSGSFIQLLVLTGLRRSEAAALLWDEVDIEKGVVTLPAARMKGRKSHILPLSPAVIDLLDHCPRRGEFVFSTTGARALNDFDFYKQRIDRLVEEIDPSALLAPWTLHDLRRSCATGLARLGVQRFIVSRVLAHADREITGVYDRHEYTAEKRAALELWARHVTGLLQPQPVETAVVAAEIAEVAHGR
jgi:integrase